MEWLVGILLGALLSYVLDFTRPGVKSYIDKSIFSSRQRKLVALSEDYKITKNYKENIDVFIVRLIQELAYILLGIALLVANIGALLITSVVLSNPGSLPLQVLALVGLVLFLIYSGYIWYFYRRIVRWRKEVVV